MGENRKEKQLKLQAATDAFVIAFDYALNWQERWSDAVSASTAPAPFRYFRWHARTHEGG